MIEIIIILINFETLATNNYLLSVLILLGVTKNKNLQIIGTIGSKTNSIQCAQLCEF